MKYDIGFLGGGQLARMSIMAAQRMGLRCLSLDPGHDAPASQVAAAVVGKLDDPEAIANLASQCDTLTWDSEFIPVAAVREGLRQSGMDPSLVTPSLETLETVQDKFLQRQAYANAGVPDRASSKSKKSATCRNSACRSLPRPGLAATTAKAPGQCETNLTLPRWPLSPRPNLGWPRSSSHFVASWR